MSVPRIAAIVPVLNEEARIGHLLDDLEERFEFAEICVVDGGSRDGTRQAVEARGHTPLRAPPGRAKQMNAGAAATTSEVLLFLHADTRLPDDATREIRRVLTPPAVVAGAFRTWTVADDPRAPRRWLAPLLHLADVRSRVSSLPYGDQALFVRREVFRALGGFADIPLMEDLELSTRLQRMGRIGRARSSVTVSGRRFLESPLRYTLLVNTFPLLFRMGVAPERLAALYRDVR